jgi:hypothetical protein
LISEVVELAGDVIREVELAGEWISEGIQLELGGDSTARKKLERCDRSHRRGY